MLQEHDWSRMLLLCSWYYFVCVKGTISNTVHFAFRSQSRFCDLKVLVWKIRLVFAHATIVSGHKELSHVYQSSLMYMFKLFFRNCEDCVYHRIWQTFVVELITVICWSRNTNDIIMKMLLTIRTNPVCNYYKLWCHNSWELNGYS